MVTARSSGDIVLSFDLDDTLWPIKPVLKHAYGTTEKWIKEHHPDLLDAYQLHIENGIPDTDNEGNETHSMTKRRLTLLNNIVSKSGLSSAKQEAFVEACFDIFINARQAVSLFDHVESTLAQLTMHYRLCALTNGNADIDVIGLRPYFEQIFTADEFHVPKPDPEIFYWMCSEMGVEPSNVIHIGDSLAHDILPAKSLGMKTVWYSHNCPLEPHPAADQVATNWLELKKAIANLSA